RRVLRVQEVRGDLEPLDGLLAPRALRRADLLAEVLGLRLEVEVLKETLDGLGAHAALEVVAEALAERAVHEVVGDELLDVQSLERVQDLVEVVGLTPGRLGDALDVALGLTARRGELRALRALGLE